MLPLRIMEFMVAKLMSKQANAPSIFKLYSKGRQGYHQRCWGKPIPAHLLY